MFSFRNLTFYRLACALLAFWLAVPRAIGAEFWDALRPAQDKNDKGWMPTIVRLVARLTALAGIVVLPADALLLVFPHLTQAPFAKLVLGGIFVTALPAALIGFVGLVCMLLLLTVLALAAAIGAYNGEFVPRDGVDALRHLIWRAITSSVAIAISALSTSFLAMVGVLAATLKTRTADILRERIRKSLTHQPATTRARPIPHLCLTHRILAQRPIAPALRERPNHLCVAI
ncbi:hypothetical protein [Thiomonas sp.]